MLTIDAYLNAAFLGDVARVRQYLEENANDADAVNHANPRGETALMFAAYAGRVEVVEALLAIPNVKVNHCSHVPGVKASDALMFATVGSVEAKTRNQEEYAEVIRLLDEAGADFSLLTEYLSTIKRYDGNDILIPYKKNILNCMLKLSDIYKEDLFKKIINDDQTGSALAKLFNYKYYNDSVKIEVLLSAAIFFPEGEDRKAAFAYLLKAIISYSDDHQKQQPLSVDLLQRLKPYKPDLFNAFMQVFPDDISRLREIIERKKESDLSAVFWKGHTTLNRGTLGKINDEYQKCLLAYRSRITKDPSLISSEDFLDAAFESDLIAVQTYMNAHANDGAALNVRNWPTESALTLAVKGRYSEEAIIKVVQALLSNPLMDVNQHCCSNDNVLTFAAEYNLIKVVKILLDNGASASRANVNRETALTYPAEKGYTKMVSMLLAADIDIQVGSQYEVALNKAIKNNHHETVAALFAAPTILKKEENRDAAYAAILNVLLANKHYPLTAEQLAELKQHKRGLFDAMMKMGDVKIVEILKVIFEEKDSALSKAIWSGHPSILKARLALFYAEYVKLVPEKDRVAQPAEQSFFTKLGSVFAKEQQPSADSWLVDNDDVDVQLAPKR